VKVFSGEVLQEWDSGLGEENITYFNIFKINHPEKFEVFYMYPFAKLLVRSKYLAILQRFFP